MSKDDGNAAFPLPASENNREWYGMSLRDYFAAKVMQGFVTSAPWDEAFDHLDSAKTAYEIADAMLAARSA